MQAHVHGKQRRHKQLTLPPCLSADRLLRGRPSSALFPPAGPVHTSAPCDLLDVCQTCKTTTNHVIQTMLHLLFTRPALLLQSDTGLMHHCSQGDVRQLALHTEPIVADSCCADVAQILLPCWRPTDCKAA